MPPERSGRQTRATEREARATRRATRTRVGGSGPAAAVRHAGGRRDAPTSPASHSRTLSPKTTQLPAGEPIRATARERADGTTSCGIARLLVFLCLCGLSMQTRLPEQMHARICWWSAGSAARLKAVAWVCGRGLDGLPHWRRRDRCAKPAQATEDRARGNAQAGLGKWDWTRRDRPALVCIRRPSRLHRNQAVQRTRRRVASRRPHLRQDRPPLRQGLANVCARTYSLSSSRAMHAFSMVKSRR